MEGKIFLKSLSLKNLLSFGQEGIEVELQPLNVLIGPNGSGKSNFIEAIRLLCATPNSITRVQVEGGGFEEWIWKGREDTISSQMTIRSIADPVEPVEHLVILEYVHLNGRTSILEASLVKRSSHQGDSPLYFNTPKPGAQIVRRVKKPDSNPLDFTTELENVTDLRVDESILAQRRDPVAFPQVTRLADLYEKVKFYADLSLGRYASTRRYSDTTFLADFLFEDGSNLALVLNDLESRSDVKKAIIQNLSVFNDRIEDYHTRIVGGAVQLQLRERGLRNPISASRLSDGTLRYLCLLAILLHPDPPPLVCIEEPELGMHPDMISTIAELLIDASKRMQLIVTTHSDLLISALSHIPESVLVCDRLDEGTRIRRLDPEQTSDWLEHYSLGESWLRGAFGGTR